MNLDENILQKIEKYLNKDMTTEEEKTFLIEINSSDDIQEFLEINHQLELFKSNDGWILQNIDKSVLAETTQLFLDKDTQDFSEKIRSFQKEYKSVKINFKWIRYAALTGIAASFLLFFYISSLPKSNLSNIYKENSSWNELPSLTVKGSDSKLQLAQIEQFFKESNFNEAIKLSEQINNMSERINPNILIYKGISQLELEEYDKALKTFTELTQSNTIDHHKSYWYISLIYLKQGNKEMVIETLQKIKKNFFMYEKAQHILNKIK